MHPLNIPQTLEVLGNITMCADLSDYGLVFNVLTWVEAPGEETLFSCHTKHLLRLLALVMYSLLSLCALCIMLT